MNKIKYQNLYIFLNLFLLKNKENENIFSIPWLHIQRYHDQEIKKYDDLTIKFKETFVFKLIYLILQIFYRLNFSKCIFLKRDNINIKKYDTIIVSHLINFNQLSLKRDFYFPGIAERKNTFIILINHTRISRKKIEDQLPTNTILLSRKGSFLCNIKILYKCILAFIDVNKEIVNEGKLESKLLKKIRNEALSSSTFLNHLLKHEISNIIKKLRPLKIIFTYEGYSYERMIIAAAKEVSPKISCIGYQHAGVFQSQNIIYKSFSPKYDPDYIFCTGKVTADFCKKNIENKKIIIRTIGTQKRVFVNMSKNSFGCLVVPEGYLSEVEILLKFCIKLAIKEPSIEYIFRLHPNITDNKKVNTYLKNKFKFYKNIKLSNDNLKNDLQNSKVVLYRGSTVSVQAGCLGILPIYLKNKSDITIDPLFDMGKNELKIKDISEFFNLYYGSGYEKYKEYCQNYYSPLNKKILNEI